MSEEPKLLFEAKYIRMLDRNGWEYIERVTGSGVVMIVALSQERKLILIEQYRPAVNDRVIEFPMGIAGDQDHNQDESLNEAACRELEEETGYFPEKLKKVYVGPMNPGANAGTLNIYFAEETKKVSSGGGDDTEDILTHEVPLSDVASWLQKHHDEGKLIDPRVYTGLFFIQDAVSKI